MGLFGKSTSKQTAKLKALVKLAAARFAVARRPRLGRRSIARSDVGQLLAIGHLDRALLRVEQVIDEDNMLEVLEMIELYCKILIEQSAQFEKPKECSDDVRAAAAGLMFASARCGELPELLDARGILADKFGRDFATAAKDGSHGIVDPTLVRKLSGERASLEQKRRLAKEIAAENDIWLDFPEKPAGIHQYGGLQGKQSEPAKKAPAPAPGPAPAPVRGFVEQTAVRADCHEVQGRQRLGGDHVDQRLTQLTVEDKVLRESRKYPDARMAAEAAFESASFAAMAARAAVALSRSETQGKGPRGGGYDKVHPHPVRSPAEQEAPLPSWRAQKSPSPSPSWSDRSTATSVGSDAAYKGKGVVFDQNDEEGDEVPEDIVWPPPQPPRPAYRRTASTMGGDGAWNGAAGTRPLQGAAPDSNPRPAHRRHATEFAGGNAQVHALHGALAGQRGQYVTPPYRRNPATTAAAAPARGDAAPVRDRGGGGVAYESSAYVQPPPYARIVSALERGNEHIARHEEVRRVGTDARVLQERVYGAAAPPGQGQEHPPLDQERRAISLRTRR